jgi:aspartate/methionine/tyrosine aminotransferase
MCIDWARSKQMHVISDEVYGNSLFPGEKIVSVAECMYQRDPYKTNYLGDHVHVVAGFSKDFCISGLRAGTLFTHNQDLLAAISGLGLFGAVSN